MMQMKDVGALYCDFLKIPSQVRSQAAGLYDPGIRYLVLNPQLPALFKKMVHRHEMSHAVLASSFYGRFIALLNYLEVDLLLFWAHCAEINSFDAYKEAGLVIQSIRCQLSEGWLLMQEGQAIYGDFVFLSNVKGNESEVSDCHKTLNNILSGKDAAYAKGHNLIVALEKKFSPRFNPLLHGVLNIDLSELFNDVAGMKALKRKKLLPDLLLEKFTAGAAVDKFVLNCDDPYREVEKELTTLGYPIANNFDCTKFIEKIIKVFCEEVFPVAYTERIETLFKSYLGAETLLYQTTLGVMASEDENGELYIIDTSKYFGDENRGFYIRVEQEIQLFAKVKRLICGEHAKNEMFSQIRSVNSGNVWQRDVAPPNLLELTFPRIKESDRYGAEAMKIHSSNLAYRNSGLA